MLNFGVREVLSTKATAAPGWAYVPDTGVNASVTALQPASRKRARNQPTTTQQDTTARQDAKLLRELAALDRENHRDVSIPVPVRQKDVAGRGLAKSTPAVRKILQSQKTFANHLSDFEALSALSSSAPTPSQSSLPHSPISTTAEVSTPNTMNTGKRGPKRGTHLAIHRQTPLRKVSTASAASPSGVVKSETITGQLSKPPQTLTNSSSAPVAVTLAAPHWADSDPLLVSKVPLLPSQEGIDRLLAIPPLTYHEAKGPWTATDRRKPPRQFCEVCGYWGRVKCTRCGGKVCALECLRVHQEECFARYGA